MSEQNSVLGCPSELERSMSTKNDKLLGDKVDKELRQVLGEIITKQSFLEDSIESLRLSKDALRLVLEKLGYLNVLTCQNEEEHSHLVQTIWILLTASSKSENLTVGYMDIKLVLFNAHAVWMPKWMLAPPQVQE